MVDAGSDVLGRISTRIAGLLMGKNKVYYSDNLDIGDFVVVINAAEVKLSGNKAKNKMYISHSGYPGGLKQVTFAKMTEKSPEKVIIHAVSGMLPDNRLKTKRLARLKVFAGKDNPFKNKFEKQ